MVIIQNALKNTEREEKLLDSQRNSFLAKMSKIKRAILNPRKTLLRILMGKDAYRWYAKTLNSILEPFAANLTKLSDIHEHLITLYMLTVQMNLKNILELGTRTGESTITFLYAAKQIKGNVTSVDIDDCVEARKQVEENRLSEFWSFIQANDLELKWESPISHLFIDTSHTYKQTLDELTKFEPLVTNGGLITMHDSVAYPEVKQATLDYFKNRKDISMYEYVHCNGLLVIFKAES